MIEKNINFVVNKQWLMRVLIVNTGCMRGGASVAADRLKTALNNDGVKAKMLVREKDNDDISTFELPHSWRLRWNYVWERVSVLSHLKFRSRHLSDIDIANMGADITRLPEFREADVIHLAWINQGMISLKDIAKILKTGKPVVWTMHDAWPCTALCHDPHGCMAFETQCRNCMLLPGGGSDKDLSTVLWRRKEQLYSMGQILFVADSRFLHQMARRSRLLTGFRVETIPNPIDTYLFRPSDKAEARRRFRLPLDKKIILVEAQDADDEDEGMTVLRESLKALVAARPSCKDDCCLAVFGDDCDGIGDDLPLLVFRLGYVNDDHTMADIYNAADVYVFPALQANQPNTIMEAMACGVPAVAFGIGGIPEMIDHQRNGYLAKGTDAADLSRGLMWALFEASQPDLGREAVRKVQANYAQRQVAMKYIEVYNQAMAFKNYHI